MEKIRILLVVLAVTSTATLGGVLDDLKGIASQAGLVYVDVGTLYGKAYYVFAGKLNGYSYMVAVPADVQSPEAMACSVQAGMASALLTKELHLRIKK